MQRSEFSFSFEIYPPTSSEAVDHLIEKCLLLNKLKPRFFSVTFGASGSSQEKTQELVEKLRALNINTVPHISCVDMSYERLITLLDHYKNLGITQLVVIRGDFPNKLYQSASDFHYANELLAAIQAHSNNYFHISVAAYPEFHPQAESAETDLHYLKQKVNLGANDAITQFFFNYEAFSQFETYCTQQNIHIPLIPGIMPIHNFTKLTKFAENCGAEIPLWLKKRMQTEIANEEFVKHYGIEIVSELCEKLLINGAKHLHFYTLNHVEIVSAILARLK